MLDLWDACARQAARANHNPPAASNAAIARNRCFAFIVFCFDSASHSLWLRHCARISGVGFRFGTKAGNSGAKRQRAGMNSTPFEMALTNSTRLSGRKCPIRPRFHPGNSARRDEFQTVPGCGEFSPPLHRLLWELLEWHAGVEPISHARSRRTFQVAQHDHRLARLRIHAKNRVHSRSAAAVTVGPRLVGRPIWNPKP